ncbi:MAG: hypothetical protein M2R45_01022 [Verrucomicrobia subdivision 3 bacterium]|nr:hypothetical protein [Limisphaerales bacterium]MCS1414134.1 hypothetical protein [Limisphaerales bacterium]
MQTTHPTDKPSPGSSLRDGTSWIPWILSLFTIFIIGCQTNPSRIVPYQGKQSFPPRQNRLTPERTAIHPKHTGYASFYGEELRGSLMANGKPFDPDQLTAASWFFRFGTQILVVHENRSVKVTITDRGPAHHLVRQGRIIDLSRAAFETLADLRLGLIYVRLYRVQTES